MLKLLEQELAGYDLVICNPINHAQRRGHVYIEHPEAARICKALKMKKVIPDFRTPSGIRLAPVALYNSFEDVYDCMQVLKPIMTDQLSLESKNQMNLMS